MASLFDQFDVLGAMWMTIKLTAISAVLALVLGTIVAIMRLSPVPALRLLGTSYVNLLRNTPLTLIVFFCLLGMWQTMGIELSPELSVNAFRYAIIGLTVYHAAFVCEALRSGVNTIPLGQAEAARSIGLTFGQSLREVVLPQAFRGAITPLGNTLIALAKNTTVVVTIGVAELAYFMADVNEQASDQLTNAFIIAAAFFVLFTIPMGLGTGWLSKRLAVKR
ncbi:glutamate transport system permease protein [Barrientosiimonas humi]|uniref:Glutamate transport system permease protein n=2 Tax=Barrientosiimonas TaxID=1535207 RepID=A0A542XCN2_9MICO|nr:MULTISPECIES: amino acid ABC transporter permease [Barrientosiimonas]TQL33516.1 glutamate transport system permease protein [Barrientosiimonas humi]BDZ58431.1 ABC transporter permease [Barrientosiimonas endolithica]CAG7573504.1 putative glutamine ABC transporter permease protein GlnM [Barrientosiimonas humi]